MSTLALGGTNVATTPGRVLAGRVSSGIAVAFLTFDCVIKLLQLAPVKLNMAQLGYPGHLAVVIGTIELVCLVLYLVPRTALLGALLFTGYLGGAIASHLRVGNPLFTHILFPTYVAALLWGGLYLRDDRLRALIR
jgi:hypothetical protein